MLDVTTAGEHAKTSQLLKALINEGRNVRGNGIFLSRMYLQSGRYLEDDALVQQVGPASVANATTHLKLLGFDSAKTEDHHFTKPPTPIVSQPPADTAIIAYHQQHMVDGICSVNNLPWAVRHSEALPTCLPVLSDEQAHDERHALLTGYRLHLRTHTLTQEGRGSLRKLWSVKSGNT